MFFSVVIPSYNSADYLAETLQSLAIQDFKDFEVVVVDDNSTDNSVAVAQNTIASLGMQGSVCRKPPNLPRGVAANRNFGVDIAIGQWICFLDSDDKFFPGKLAGTHQAITSHGATYLAFHHGIRQFQDHTNHIISVTSGDEKDKSGNILPSLLTHNFITTSSVTVHKSLIKQLGGFDTGLHGVEDYLFWLRVARKTHWFYSPEIWTDYRVRDNSLMGGRRMLHYVTQNRALYKTATQLHEFSPPELRQLSHTLFQKQMPYYALVSLSNYGWSDFVTGLWALARAGYPRLAIGLCTEHLLKRIKRKLYHTLKHKV